MECVHSVLQILSYDPTAVPLLLCLLLPSLSFTLSLQVPCQPIHLLTCPLVYSHYYIYVPWNRFFSVVPLHRHQE